MIAEIQFSDAAKLALIPFISTVLGALWGSYLSARGWRRQTLLELHRQRYSEGTKFLEELSQLIGRRFFLLQRLLWTIETADPTKIADAEKTYYESVHDWNARYWLNRNKIRLLVSESQAEWFLTYAADEHRNDPHSLHYSFVHAHRLVFRAKESLADLPAATAAVTQLNWKCSKFLEHLTTEFLERASSLTLLRPPDMRPKPNDHNA